jgi:hypothetical protein
VHVLDPIRGDSILQGLQNAVERPGARYNMIVDRDAHVGSAQQQFPIPLADRWEPGVLPIDHARLDVQPHLLCSGVERCINAGLVAMDDDDVAGLEGTYRRSRASSGLMLPTRFLENSENQ